MDDEDRYLTGGGELVPEQRSASYSTNTSLGPFSGGAILSGQDDGVPMYGGRFTTQLPEGLSATLSRTNQAGETGAHAVNALRLVKQIDDNQLALSASRMGEQGLPSYGLQYSGQIGKQGGAKPYYPAPNGNWYVEAGGTPSTPERHVRGGARFNFADGGEVPHMANGGISYSGDFSTPDYYQVYNALPNAGFAGQFVQRMFPNPSTTGAYDAYMKQLASNVSAPAAPMQPYLVAARPVVDPVVAPFAAATPPASMMPANNFNLAQFSPGPNTQQAVLAPPKMVQPEGMAHGGMIDAALHAARQHFDEGGFLDSVRNLFSGPDYLSTGEAASPTNWGDPESAADFFKADRALRLARELQAKEPEAAPPRQVQERAPVEAAPRQQIASPPPAPTTEPAPAQPQFRLTAEPLIGPYDFGQRLAGRQFREAPPHLAETPGFGQSMLDGNKYADMQPEVPTSQLQKYTLPEAALVPPAPQATINNAVSLAQDTERPPVKPLAYTATPIAAPAAAAIDQATGKLTARAPQGPDLNDRQRDLIIRTIAAETSGKSPEESQAIAHVILNRIQSGQYGATPEAVLFARKQFEPWSNPNGANYPMRFSPDSRRYGMGQAALDAALGADDITNGATNFWAPKAQAALGRPAPAWGRTGGVDIGETRFHNLSRAEGGEVEAPDEVNQALDVVRQADGEAVGQGQEAPTPEDAAVTIARSQPVTPASLARAWTTPEEAIEAGVGPRARTLMETYPVAVSKGIAAMPSAVAHSIQDPFELAHQAATNQLPPDYFHSDEGIGRALNAANLAMTGGLGGVEAATGETVLGAGPVRKVGMGHNMPPPDETFNLPQLLQTEKRRGVDVLNQTAALAGKDPKFSKFGAPLSDLETTISRKNDLVPYKSLSPEQLYREGAYIAPALGDLTGAGYMVHEINGIPLSRPVDVTGGGEYMRSAMANAQGQESAWASRPSTAQTMLNKINNQVPEGAPVYMSHTLMGVPSMDSSHMVMQGVLRQIPHLAGKIDPVGAMVVDDFIRSHLPSNAQKDWPGILNADAAEAYLMGKPGTWSSTVVKALDKSGAVKAGFPDVGATRFAMMEPRLAAGNQLSSGFALSRLDPGGKLISNPMLGHETYAGKMPSIGGYAGGFENQIPMDKMFSDWFKGRPATYTEEATGLIKPTTKTMHQQAMMTQVPVQKATQQWLDTVMDHMRQNPQKWGYSSGGLANP